MTHMPGADPRSLRLHHHHAFTLVPMQGFDVVQPYSFQLARLLVGKTTTTTTVFQPEAKLSWARPKQLHSIETLLFTKLRLAVSPPNHVKPFRQNHHIVFSRYHRNMLPALTFFAF